MQDLLAGHTLYKTILNSIILPLSDRILGLSIQKDLSYWRKLQWYPEADLKRIQQENLKAILTYCATSIPYYKDVCNKISFNPDMPPVAELKKFPFLDKNIIKQNLPNGITSKKRKTYSIDYTSGSLGVQGAFHSDKLAYSKSVALQMLWWEWAGYRFGDKAIQTGMNLNRGIVRGLKDIMLKVKYTQAFQMDNKIIMRNLKSLRGTGSYFFLGYASSLYTYAKVAKDNGVNDIKFKAVISWGDKMFPHYKKLIKKQFDTKVFDTYGACEGTMIAAECEYHNYHIMTPHVFIEVLDKDGNEVAPGELGEVVVTRLDNFLMPLIRYKIYDLAIKSDITETCPCGRKFPMLKKIIGRDTDIVKTKKGKTLIVHFFTGIFEYIEEIQQFQVVQHSLDDIEIRYIPSGKFYYVCLEKITNEIWKKANERICLRFTEVNCIDPTPSGKPQIIMSEIIR